MVLSEGMGVFGVKVRVTGTQGKRAMRSGESIMANNDGSGVNVPTDAVAGAGVVGDRVSV